MENIFHNNNSFILLKMGRLRFSEMSVRNYHYSLHNDREGCSSQDKTVVNPRIYSTKCGKIILYMVSEHVAFHNLKLVNAEIPKSCSSPYFTVNFDKINLFTTTDFIKVNLLSFYSTLC
jgi:hypothetical protein